MNPNGFTVFRFCTAPRFCSAPLRHEPYVCLSPSLRSAACQLPCALTLPSPVTLPTSQTPPALVYRLGSPPVVNNMRRRQGAVRRRRKVGKITKFFRSRKPTERPVGSCPTPPPTTQFSSSASNSVTGVNFRTLCLKRRELFFPFPLRKIAIPFAMGIDIAISSLCLL